MSPGSNSLDVPSEGSATTEAKTDSLPFEQAVVHCAECGQECAIAAIWCPHCGAPNKAAPAELVDDDVGCLLERIALYERLLEDLKRPASEPLADPETPQVVRSFCESQLRGLRSASRRRALRDMRRNFVARVKSAAHRPDLQAALQICQRPARLPADDPVVQELRRQLEERLASECQAARQTAETLAWQRAAQHCLQNGQPAEAVAKLKAVLERQPDDQPTLKMLHEAEQQFVEQTLSAEVPTPSPPADQAELAEQLEPVDWAGQAEATPASAATQETASPRAETAGPVTAKPAAGEPTAVQPAAAEATPLVAPARAAQPPAAPSHSFVEAEEVPSPTQRHIEAFSQWTSLIKPFLLDNVGWFVGAFLVVAGFIVLIVTFWNTIEQNQILLHSLVYASTLVTTGLFFALAYFMRVKYPRLENSSDTLLVIVALLIPLVFAAAVLTALIPASVPAEATGYLEQVRAL